MIGSQSDVPRLLKSMGVKMPRGIDERSLYIEISNCMELYIPYDFNMATNLVETRFLLAEMLSGLEFTKFINDMDIIVGYSE